MFLVRLRFERGDVFWQISRHDTMELKLPFSKYLTFPFPWYWSVPGRVRAWGSVQRRDDMGAEGECQPDAGRKEDHTRLDFGLLFFRVR